MILEIQNASECQKYFAEAKHLKWKKYPSAFFPGKKKYFNINKF